MTEWLGHGELGTPTESAGVVKVEPRFIEAWAAIEQLQSVVDALKAQAAPTPVEDEVTEAEREAVAGAMYECSPLLMGASVGAKWKWAWSEDRTHYRGLADVAIAAMRAARVPAPTPAVVGPNEIRAYYAKQGYHDVDEFYKEETPTPEPSAEPSEELRLLRELRQAVLEVQRKTHVHYSEVDKVLYALAALDALHPGDTEEK